MIHHAPALAAILRDRALRQARAAETELALAERRLGAFHARARRVSAHIAADWSAMRMEGDALTDACERAEARLEHAEQALAMLDAPAPVAFAAE